MPIEFAIKVNQGPPDADIRIVSARRWDEWVLWDDVGAGIDGRGGIERFESAQAAKRAVREWRKEWALRQAGRATR